MVEIYAQDSFFTLGLWGRIGLALLSAVLCAALAWLITRGPRGIGGVFGAGLLFYLFVWLSPQIYYGYYQMIFDGLPWQVVVGSPPGAGEMVQTATFSGKDTLSDHGKGALFWLMIGAVAVRLRQRRRD